MTTSVNPFAKATMVGNKVKLALIGPTGSGKTYTGLVIGSRLAELDGGRVAVIDTENRTATKYASHFDFDHLALSSFAPMEYVKAIKQAEEHGYSVVIVDSLSHAWSGTDGALEQVDKAKARSKSKNGFAAWRDVTPMHNALIDALVQSDVHMIATMRAKQHYAIDQVEENGRTKTEITRLGLAPVQRDGMEYEFDVVGDIDQEHRLVITKSRCFELADAVLMKPGAEVADTLHAWVEGGVEAPQLVSDEQRAALRDRIQVLSEGRREALKASWPLSPPLGSADLNVDHYVLIDGALEPLEAEQEFEMANEPFDLDEPSPAEAMGHSDEAIAAAKAEAEPAEEVPAPPTAKKRTAKKKTEPVDA